MATTLSLGSSNSSAFPIASGGTYGIAAIATWGGGSVDLQILGPDGATYLSVLDTVFVANGVKLVQLPVGTYKFVVTTATAVYVSIGGTP